MEEVYLKKLSKNKIYNSIMAIAIMLMVVAGVMVVGNLRGWFGDANSYAINGENVSCSEKIGAVSLERDGVSYELKENDVLRDGDIIETKHGGMATIKHSDANLSLNDNTKVSIKTEEGNLAFEVFRGEAFADTNKKINVHVDEKELELEGVSSISVPIGTIDALVLNGNAKYKENLAEQGQTMTILEKEVLVGEAKIESLNEFIIARIAIVDTGKSLCFKEADIEKLKSDRQAEEENAKKEILAKEDDEIAVEEARQYTIANPNETVKKSSSKDKDSKIPAILESDSCTITIRCDTILNNMGDLTSGKNKYVPSNGTILATSSVDFDEGETVFDVLKRTCSRAGIQLEYSYTPLYGSYYIQGINNLYEFDCGAESGWMYKVNGWFPNYGCSSYELKDGDSIVWCYTCKGLGADVGSTFM